MNASSNHKFSFKTFKSRLVFAQLEESQLRTAVLKPESCSAEIDFNVPGKPNPPPVKLLLTLWHLGKVFVRVDCVPGVLRRTSEMARWRKQPWSLRIQAEGVKVALYTQVISILFVTCFFCDDYISVCWLFSCASLAPPRTPVNAWVQLGGVAQPEPPSCPVPCLQPVLSFLRSVRHPALALMQTCTTVTRRRLPEQRCSASVRGRQCPSRTQR